MIRRHLPFRLAALPFVALIVALVVSCMQTPVTGRSAFVLFDDGEMSQLGTEAFAEVKKENRPSHDARSKAVIDRVVERIVSRAGPETQGTRWEVQLFDSDEVNAFALPAESVPPMRVAITSHGSGRPPSASTMTGAVVTSSSSTTRSFMRAT